MGLELRLPDADLRIDADAVLRAQGADPAVIRTRSPHLVDIARQALREAEPRLEPKVVHRQLEVTAVRHDRLELEGHLLLHGPAITGHLAAAHMIIAVLCTVGARVEEYASQLMPTDPVLALAADAVGTAGVQALAGAVCAAVDQHAASRNMHATAPLSPGIIGWPIEAGQPFIFELLDASKIGVVLSPHGMMIPRKTVSMLIGVGQEFGAQGKTCDYCGMKEKCRYQGLDHYARQ